MVNFHQMGNAMRDHSGFSAAGAGQQQERAFHMFNCRSLLWIQPFKEIH
jgi:hypothetical protein